MNNPVAKNCNKFNRAATHANKKKGWCPDLDEELEEYFDDDIDDLADLADHAEEIAIREYAERVKAARVC